MYKYEIKFVKTYKQISFYFIPISFHPCKCAGYYYFAAFED